MKGQFQVRLLAGRPSSVTLWSRPYAVLPPNFGLPFLPTFSTNPIRIEPAKQRLYDILQVALWIHLCFTLVAAAGVRARPILSSYVLDQIPSSTDCSWLSDFIAIEADEIKLALHERQD